MSPAMTEHAFQAEVSRVLSLVINSLYSDKEIFLRELVSNASDALDKLRFRSLTDPSLLGDQPDLEIHLRVDAEAGTLTIADTGVGMTEEELIKNLGTVAHSGSAAFMQALEQQAQKKDVNIIGQFGVGFYSAYLVADRVTVTTLAAGADQKAVRWESAGKDSFTVEPADKTTRGTEIVLHLKEEQKGLLEDWKLRDLVRRYSDYVGYPIKTEEEQEAEQAEGEGDKKEVTKKLVTINQASALWQRPKSEVEPQQYDDLYRHLTSDYEAPLAHTHFRVEGNVEFVGLLYVPKHPPFDLDDPRKRKGVRLFVRRVFIMDDCDEITPQWLRFVRGVVDSDDLPLNVSRELLQESSVLRTIKKQATKRVLDLLAEMATDKADHYKTFYGAFGKVLKEGLAVDAHEYKEKVAQLVRYESTKTGADELVSLEAYVARMPEGQKDIYYLTGESRQALSGSPYLEALTAKGYEVLLMTDPVDEWAAEGLGEFQGKKLVSAMRADLSVPKTDDEKKADEEQFKSLEPLVKMAQSKLSDVVREVKLSDRLTDSPACLVLGFGATPAHLEKILRQAGKSVPQAKRVLELNPKHPMIQKLGAMATDSEAQGKLGEYMALLYDQALLSEGSPLPDPNAFAKRVTALMTFAVGAK